MSLHTVLIAVTVDDKYSANEVASEFKYFLPYISSECLDTVSDVIPARIKPQVHTYMVWSSGMADGCDTYAKLTAYEGQTGFSYSSEVTTDNIDAFVEAINNEFNGELLYHLMESA